MRVCQRAREKNEEPHWISLKLGFAAAVGLVSLRPTPERLRPQTSTSKGFPSHLDWIVFLLLLLIDNTY